MKLGFETEECLCLFHNNLQWWGIVTTFSFHKRWEI